MPRRPTCARCAASAAGAAAALPPLARRVDVHLAAAKFGAAECNRLGSAACVVEGHMCKAAGLARLVVVCCRDTDRTCCLVGVVLSKHARAIVNWNQKAQNPRKCRHLVRLGLGRRKQPMVRVVHLSPKSGVQAAVRSDTV